MSGRLVDALRKVLADSAERVTMLQNQFVDSGDPRAFYLAAGHWDRWLLWEMFKDTKHGPAIRRWSAEANDGIAG